MTATRWTPIYLTLAVIMAAILALLLWAVPVDEDGTRRPSPPLTGPESNTPNGHIKNQRFMTPLYKTH